MIARQNNFILLLSLLLLFLLLLGHRPLIWGGIMVLRQRHVRQDVVLSIGLGTLAEVPGLLLGEVGAILETLEFVLEVDHIVGLLVPERPILHTA